MAPSDFHPQHLQEYVQSAIDSDIIALNFRSLGQAAAFDFIVPNPQRRNDGRLTDRYLRIFNGLEAGAWLCNGIDVLTMTPSAWGCLKPNSPRWDDKNRKAIKYEHPWGIPTELFCLRVTYRIGLKIAIKAGAVLEAAYLERMAGVDPSTEDVGFWQWVKDTPQIQIIITEGTKKAGSLLSAGYCAIALPGIYGGYRSKINGVECLPRLIPQLEIFASTGREITFAFDRDEKLSTIRNVCKAIDKTGKLLGRKGCRVSVIAWNRPCKGVDDLIASFGVEVLDRVFNERLTLDLWRLAQSFSLDRYLARKVNTRYLDPDVKPEKLGGKIIALKSAKGTGKTEYLAKILQPELDRGRPILILTHRIQLAKALAARMGINHFSEVRDSETGSLSGYSLCVDSLHPNSQARFNPEAWDGAIVVIDECEQVFWHLLNSNTCIGNRVAILRTFERLLRTVAESGGSIVLADADLSQVSIEYVQSLTEKSLELWLLTNSYNPNQGAGRQLFTYDSPSLLLAAACSEIQRGQKVMLHCSTQKYKSKWSTQNIETTLAAKCPQARILRVDSETVTDPTHPAYGCVENLDRVIADYDVVLASPTIETGISIDIAHFDSVWALACGVQTVDAVCQTLERVRADVPRHLCITTGSIKKVGNGSDSVAHLLYSEHKLFQANWHCLSKVDEFAHATGHDAEHLRTWAKYAVKVNQGFNSYKQAILAKLSDEGYSIDPVASSCEPPNSDLVTAVKEAIESARTDNYRTERAGKIAAPNPDDLELAALKQKTAMTKQERYTEAKGILTRRYLTEDITDELILKDDAGWYPQLQLHYYLTLGREHLTARDRGKARSLNPDGLPFKPDLNRATLSLKIKALEFLDIQQFFGEDKTFTSGDLTEWFERVLHYRHDLREILKVNISPDSSPIQAAQQLLAVLGMKLEYIDRRRIEGIPIRHYAGVYYNADSRQDVLERWFDRDERLAGMGERSTPSYIPLMESLA